MLKGLQQNDQVFAQSKTTLSALNSAQVAIVARGMHAAETLLLSTDLHLVSFKIKASN